MMVFKNDKIAYFFNIRFSRIGIIVQSLIALLSLLCFSALSLKFLFALQSNEAILELQINTVLFYF